MKRKTILVTALLSLPVVLFLVHHYFYVSPGLSPTGFTINENVLYMSYARQYNDQGGFSLFYSNPFDGNPGSPRIYFQPVILLLSWITKTGIDPGLCFSLFGLFMAFATIHTGLRILRFLLRNNNWVFQGILFTWGGGLLSIAGLAAWLLLPGYSVSSWQDAVHQADPAWGWWGLNWGRSLFIPLEAYYHFLFLQGIYSLLTKKWKTGIIVAILLSVSHPFTGIEYLLIINGWLLIERFIYRNKSIPFYFLAGHLLITVFHLGYYLFWLNQFPEHRILFNQYSASWTYSLWIVIPAYLITGVLATAGIRKNKKTGLLNQTEIRLLLSWAIISFLLSKHEWFMRPLQPIHFTRGYTWAALFFLATPYLNWLLTQWETKWRTLVFVVFTAFFLTDNFIWTYTMLAEKNTTESESHLSPATKDILLYLQKTTRPDDLITGNAPLVSYMANVYSAANVWISHPYNTPEADKRKKQMQQFLQTGIPLPEWAGRHVLIITDKENKNSSTVNPVLLQHKLFENNRYILSSL